MRKKPVGINNPHQRGVSLIETLMGMMLVAVLIFLAMPSWSRHMEKENLRAAVESLLGDLYLLRSEAVQRNKSMTIQFSTGTFWCYGLSEGSPSTCQCTTAPQLCTIGGVPRLISYNNFKNIRLVSSTFANNQTGFESTRSLALQVGSWLLQSSSGLSVTVTLNAVGMVQACSNNFSNFPPC
ncbi:MAG: GspH/FimT family pseudopilin [Magnetococcus sp. DMHC-6]